MTHPNIYLTIESTCSNLAPVKAIVWASVKSIVRYFSVSKDVLVLAHHSSGLMFASDSSGLMFASDWFGHEHPRFFFKILPWPYICPRVGIMLIGQTVSCF